MLTIPKFNYEVIKLPKQTDLDKLSIHYNSLIAYFLLQKIQKEFHVKSLGNMDSLGVKWKALSLNRRIYKPLRKGEVSKSLKRKIKTGRISKRKALLSREPLINIDTTRLVKALTPGKIVGGRYTNYNSDQNVVITSKGISLEIRVPYADDVQRERPFLPVNVEPWLNIAISIANRSFERILRTQKIIK